MLLSKKYIFKNDKINMTILQHMGYSAYKLWNVGNYEKRNYEKLGMKKFPDWYDQKKRLKDNFFYKNLPSQTAQDILQLLQEGWKSYFTLLKTGGVKNPKPPRFRREIMDITFLKDAIKQIGDTIRLTISKQLKQYLSSININANYIYLKTNRFSNINIKELQIKFIDKDSFAAIAVYEIKDTVLMADNNNYLSIDLGLKNNFTCYDSNDNCFIINGFLKSTHYYDKKIAYYQSICSAQQFSKGIRYPQPSKRVLALYKKRKNCVNDFLHKATTYIKNYCVNHAIHTVIIGDITGIRKNKDIGRNNQQLHTFPYKRIYELLKYKLLKQGIVLVLKNENYSSQCAPDTPYVSKKYATKLNRKHRGLYVSNNTLYNADCVGAYNILRLYLQEINRCFPEFKSLSSPVKVSV